MFLSPHEKKKKDLPRDYQLWMSEKKQTIKTNISQREQASSFLTHEKLTQSNSIVKYTSEFVLLALLPRQLGYFFLFLK